MIIDLKRCKFYCMPPDITCRREGFNLRSWALGCLTKLNVILLSSLKYKGLKFKRLLHRSLLILKRFDTKEQSVFYWYSCLKDVNKNCSDTQWPSTFCGHIKQRVGSYHIMSALRLKRLSPFFFFFFVVDVINVSCLGKALINIVKTSN